MILIMEHQQITAGELCSKRMAMTTHHHGINKDSAIHYYPPLRFNIQPAGARPTTWAWIEGEILIQRSMFCCTPSECCWVINQCLMNTQLSSFISFVVIKTTTCNGPAGTTADTPFSVKKLHNVWFSHLFVHQNRLFARNAKTLFTN